MHVLFIPSWYPTPANQIAGSFVREQAQALKNRGITIAVLYMHLESLRYFFRRSQNPMGFYKNLDGSFPEYMFFGYRIPRMRVLTKFIAQRGLVKVFKKYIQEYGLPDVLHVQAMENCGNRALNLKRRYNIQYVVTEHSTKFARGLIKPFLLAELKTITQQSEKLIAVSREFGHLLDEVFNLKEGTWKYIPNVVDNSFLQHPLNIPSVKGKTRFICVAFLTPKKAVDLLLKAFKLAFHDADSVELIVAGDGGERKSLEELSSFLGLQKQVAFKGRLSRSEVRDEISRSDFLVISSLVETFGVVAVEALALGKAVLATRCGGPESILEENDGLLVDRGSVSSLASGLQYMYQNKSSFDAADIRKRCEARFGEAKIATEIIKVYEEAVLKAVE